MATFSWLVEVVSKHGLVRFPAKRVCNRSIASAWWTKEGESLLWEELVNSSNAASLCTWWLGVVTPTHESPFWKHVSVISTIKQRDLSIAPLPHASYEARWYLLGRGTTSWLCQQPTPHTNARWNRLCGQVVASQLLDLLTARGDCTWYKMKRKQRILAPSPYRVQLVASTTM